MNLHRGERSELSSQLFSLEGEGFFSSFALDQFSGKAGHGDGSLATEGLEGGPIDDLFAFFLLKLNPEPEHFPAFGIAHCADGIRIGQFYHILRIAHRFSDSLFHIRVHSIAIGLSKAGFCARNRASSSGLTNIFASWSWLLLMCSITRLTSRLLFRRHSCSSVSAG